MKKFYQEHEILFAILVIAVYTVVMGNLRRLGDDGPFMMIGLIAFSALVYLFVRKNALTEYYGLSGWAKNNREMLWFIPLWIIAGCNLWGGIAPEYPLPGQIYAAVSMLFVGFAEEMIFRGFLFKAMLKDGSVKTAIIVSSVTFGAGHIVNLLIGQDFFETLMQVFFAVAVGFAFTMAFYKSGSLLPCILAHSLIDVFAVFAAGKGGTLLNAISYCVMTATSIAYGLYLMKRVETPAVNRCGMSGGDPLG